MLRMRRPTFLICLLLLLGTAPATRSAEPTVESLLREGRSQLGDYEYRRAETAFRQALDRDPDCVAAHLGLGRVFHGLGEHPRSRASYERALKLTPERPEPFCGLGSLALKIDRIDEARRWYASALEVAPDDPGSLAGMARVAIEEKDLPRADELLDRCEARHRDHSSVLSTRAEYHFRNREMTECARTWRRLLEKNPSSLAALNCLTNGFRELHRPPYRGPGGPPAYEEKIAAATKLYRDLELDDAQAAFTKLGEGLLHDGRPAFFLGLIELRRGRPRAAAVHLRSALDLEPDHHLYGNALVHAYRLKIVRQRAEHGGGPDGVDRMASFAKDLIRGEVAGVAEVVRGYDRLLPMEQRVIRRAVAPFAAYLPRLIERGITHDILGFEEGITDAKERAWLDERRTHDLRWYGGLRGVGGKNAATGIEHVLDAAELRYDTFAHEFAHQVHVHAMSDAEKGQIAALYKKATKESLCLDYYAESNDREYFAVGYEAWISLVKHPFHAGLRRHSRAELLARDPELYAFIARVTGAPAVDPQIEELSSRILGFYRWAGDRATLEAVRKMLVPAVPAGSPEGK